MKDTKLRRTRVAACCIPRRVRRPALRRPFSDHDRAH